MSRRLALGDVAQCRACDGTGRVRAPAMSFDMARWRARENERRRRARLEPLTPPPTMVPCEICKGAGIVPVEVADASVDDTPPPGSLWE